MQHPTRLSIVITVLLCFLLSACNQQPLPTPFIITTTPRATWTPTVTPLPSPTTDESLPDTGAADGSTSPTPGITVTPPTHTKIVTVNRTAADLNSQARYLLYNSDPKATTSASLRISSGAIIFTWTGTVGNRKGVTQRIVMTPRLNQGGILSMDVYSATQDGVKIDGEQTILGPDYFRSRSMLTLIIQYSTVVSKKMVSQNDTYTISRFDINASRIAVDQWVPAN